MRWWAAVLPLALLVAACSEPYRVGEYVLVEWGDDGKLYPAYVVEISGPSRFRVHFEGYDARWDEDVGVDRIKGRVEGPVVPPPPPAKVARASQPRTPKPPPSGAPAPAGSASASAPSAAGSAALLVNPFNPGDRVRITWRGSVYAATVIEIVAKDRMLIHYEGYESVWDEVVHTERVVSKRP